MYNSVVRNTKNNIAEKPINDILPVWQPKGFSTHIITKNIAKKYNVKTAHTGTLDPMAEGVVVVLLGPERLNKKEFAKWKKEYVFEIVFGISTDTLDGLGLVEDFSFDHKPIVEDTLTSVLQSFAGSYKQKYPKYSAKKVLGKPLHWYSREEKLDSVNIPTKKGEIFEIELLSFGEITPGKMVKNLVGRINKVTGDLRQQEIIGGWKNFLEQETIDRKTPLKTAKIRVLMSKGLYIRGLARDISKKLEVPGFVYTLVRTKNGRYTKEDCKTLEQIFGSDFMNKYNFVSRGKS